MLQKITPFLWFDTQAEEAAEFYVALFDDAEIIRVDRHGEGGPLPAGSVMSVDFRLAGQQFAALNGGPLYTFSEAVSFVISCASQAEIDHYWDALTEGGTPGPCGWLKDRFGVSWQVVHSNLSELLGDPDPERAGRAVQAMLQMSKLDIAALLAAREG